MRTFIRRRPPHAGGHSLGQVSLLFLLLLITLPLFAARPLAAQDCEVRYRVGTSNTWQFISLNAGGVWNGTVNNLRDIENVGRNDFMVRTSGAFGIRADNTLIANVGGGTIVLPPAVWTGLQLQRISCRSYATVYDSGSFLQQFGTSAAALADTALADARKAAEGARDQAVAIFNSGVEALAAGAEARLAQTSAAWQAFRDSVTAAAGLIPIVVEQHFPELHVALTATGEWSWGLGPSTVALWTSHAQGAKDAILALDASLGASAALQEAFTVDMARDFPEVYALLSTSCSLDPAPFLRAGDRLNQLAAGLQALGSATMEAVWPSAIADPLLDGLWGIASRMARGPCDPDLRSLAASLQADRGALQTYLTDAQRALQAVDARSLARGQEEFGNGVAALGRDTGALLQMLLDQEQLEQAVEFRATEVRQASERLVGETGRREGVELFSPQYWERRSRQGDEDELEREAEALLQATERYEAAVRAREAGWVRIGDSWGRWTRDAAGLVALVPRLEIQVRGTDELVRVLSSPPRLSTPARALREASSCMGQAVQGLRAELTELRRLTQDLLSALKDAFEFQGLSPELQERLVRIQNLLGETIQRAAALEAASRDLGIQAGAVAGSVGALSGQLAQDPADSQYMDRVEMRLDNVRSSAEGLVDARAAASAALAGFLDAQKELGNELQTFLPQLPVGQIRADLERGWNDVVLDAQAVQAGAQSALACAEDLRVRAVQARTATPERAGMVVRQALAVLADAAAANLPPSLRAEMDATLAAADALLAAYGSAAGQVVQVGQKAAVFAAVPVTSAVDLIQGGESSGGNPALSLMEDARSAAMDFWMTSLLLLQVRHQLQGPQNAFATRLGALAVEVGAAGNGAAWGAAGIAWQAVDLDLISGEYEKAQYLAERWGSAVYTFPTRLAALVGVSLPPALTQIQPSVTLALNQMQGHVSAMNQCVAEGGASRTALQAQTLVNTAASQAVQGFQAEAQGVITDLTALLTPSLNLLDTVANVFSRASALRDRLLGMGSTGAGNFQSLASTAVQGVTEAAQCLQTRSGQVTSLENQVTSQMAGS